MEEAQSSQRNYMDGERDTLDYFSAMGVAPEAAEAVSVLFRWIDVDGGGEVAIMEFLAACTVVTEAFEDDFPPELLTLEVTHKLELATLEAITRPPFIRPHPSFLEAA